MRRIAIAILAVILLPGLAMAQAQKKIGGPVGHALDVIQGDSTPSGASPSADTGASPCDYKMISGFDPIRILTQLKACLAVKGANDAQAALDSAKAANDSVAQTCLAPAVALLKAAEGTTTPAVDTEPTFTPAGPLLLFQKLREFAMAGGVPNCRSWVNTTLVAAAPIQ